MHMCNKHAFTLAELLTAVLVISVIMVALAPVITKRMSENMSISSDSAKKGTEIYTNPGYYTFDVPTGINTLFIQGSGGGGGGGGATYIDKKMTIVTSTTWTVPKGVNQVSFTIYGSGGGGGGGYAKTQSSGCPSGTNTLSYVADNGKDLCVTTWQNPANRSGFVSSVSTVNLQQGCYSGSCCWKDNEGKGRRTVCTYPAAYDYCLYTKNMRLIKKTEMQRIKDRKLFGSTKLGICSTESQSTSIVPVCKDLGYGSTPGTVNNVGWPYWIWLDNQYAVPVYNYYSNGTVNMTFYAEGAPNFTPSEAYSVFCATESESWIQYSAAGGNSGAKYTRTIDVLPGDKLSITVGNGGSGGTAGANGSRGGDTIIKHLDKNSVLLGEYKVMGGLGGNKATNSNNGASIVNGAAAGQTTPSGTCYINYKTTRGATSYISENVSCNVLSYSGTSGTQLQGGSGGMFENKGTAFLGGGLDSNNGVGYSATTNGFGGGGGNCKRGARSPASCQAGGSGGNGLVDISYRIVLPGSGGGSGTRVGGYNEVSGEKKDYEIKYKVTEGTRISLQVGSGGVGGMAGQDGTNGTPTVIGDNKIIFLGGEKGKAVNSTQKNSLSDCIGSSTNSTTIASCIGNLLYKAPGGNASYISTNSTVVTSSLGLIINDLSNVSYTITSNFKGNNGKSGAQDFLSEPYIYGFDGGIGGIPFGIRSANVAPASTCGGGITGTYGSSTSANSYYCTSGVPDGNNARIHNSANNEFGGSGGGGGGAISDSSTLGSGGSGSNGYLRIRWDAGEQD